jgi:hypothetical protein
MLYEPTPPIRKNNNYIKVLAHEKKRSGEVRPIRQIELFFFNDHDEWSAGTAVERATQWALDMSKTGLETSKSVYRDTRFVALKSIGAGEPIFQIEQEGDAVV